ncbi:hypothetical protein PO909_009695 [Leuciscus waleckii]
MEGQRRYEDGIAEESVQRRFPEELVRYPSRTLCSRLADAQSGNVDSRWIRISVRTADGTQTLRRKGPDVSREVTRHTGISTNSRQAAVSENSKCSTTVFPL